MEFKIKTEMPFILAPPKIKILMEEIKEQQNKGRDIPRSWIRRFNTIKMSICPNLIYGFSAFPTQISASYFVNIERLLLKWTWGERRPRKGNTILKVKNKVRELTLSNLRTYKTMVIKTVWYSERICRSISWRV